MILVLKRFVYEYVAVINICFVGTIQLHCNLKIQSYGYGNFRLWLCIVM
jgi:hypothetical protein